MYEDFNPASMNGLRCASDLRSYSRHGNNGHPVDGSEAALI